VARCSGHWPLRSVVVDLAVSPAGMFSARGVKFVIKLGGELLQCR
jgi:hypothetical protein